MKSTIFICLLAVCFYASALNNGLARTPQMGWNSWNYWSCQVNETVIRAAADALLESGLIDYGYEYINIDDCWAKSRDENGVIQADNVTFPSGIPALADYIHARGLKFGIYSDAGNLTCAGRPGSYGHEEIDAKTYAEWGVDYLKYDNCKVLPAWLPQDRYPIMSAALNATGRPILFSMCDWGVQAPWKWAQDVGNSWRTDNDIQDVWETYIRELDNQIGLSKYAGPGGWNDPDMLEVGNGGMLFVEYKSQFSIWCLLKAPLILGNDLSNMDAETLWILTSEEVIAINQDPLGVQGDMIYQEGPIQIWGGPLAGGDMVFILFNRHTIYDLYNTTITIEFPMLGLASGTSASIRDLFYRQDMGIFQDTFSFSLAPHDVFVGRLSVVSQ